ncbi:phosphatidylinositol-specific phospholipase C/glycerophosphodiester phosphodiesterase family protein [Prauserella cavernicola]|uniref:Altered inheritance of mitochondria protein 6 n=1 Tax=Prauserella cavernicola TaxID=2800127 RepID=A0A934QSF6_9PSEU|nr:phosphatidylinositol-specific phospholipase C/glycerophosphodiester phosphodiesterase family protein [Prauserella cavernicola]MBK1785373.1 phosphatidylinositol-specific phospholipase C/glycerophosphodiester phosphodiesterase family protein [Prauserella cavernicola]
MPLSRRSFSVLTASLATAGLLGAPTVAQARPRPRVRPLAQAHAHNDYEHPRPLFDALAEGFTSVEADIHLVEGRLLVGHDPEDLTPSRTLESLYLEPLRRRVLDNHGHVYGRRADFQLLVDIKTEGESTYAALDRLLRHQRYTPLFSAYARARVRRGPVTVVVSGNRPRATMSAQRHRLAFYDGRIADPTDLGPGSDARLTPLVSENWTKLFTWAGEGKFPAAERELLESLVNKAHGAGQRVRFWATPDTEGPARTALWKALVDAGVDHVNTDDLSGLARFLRTKW